MTLPLDSLVTRVYHRENELSQGAPVGVLSQLKSAAQRLSASAVRWTGVAALAYHRIGDGRSSVFDRGLWSATQEDFDRQLAWLKAEFDVISPGDTTDVPRLQRGRHVIVTFDDGYDDNYTLAYPVLRAHRLPATFFVATGFIDDPRLPFWDEIAWMVRTSRNTAVELRRLPARLQFDEPQREKAVRTLLRLYKSLPEADAEQLLDAIGESTGTGRHPGAADARCWMNWDMLREMQGGGMTIGGHTANHRILSHLARAEQRDEIGSCARRIGKELGIPMQTFSYPNGTRDSFNDDTRDCLREQGVTTAFSYYGGFRPLSAWDDYDIRRIGVEQDTTLDAFRTSVLAPW